jgi:hypothetical protein
LQILVKLLDQTLEKFLESSNCRGFNYGIVARRISAILAAIPVFIPGKTQ